MSYPSSNTGTQTWDEGNVEEGFDSLVARTLEQNDVNPEGLSRDEANDIVVALGPEFSEEELHDFHEFRDVLLGVLSPEKDVVPSWRLNHKSGRGQVMEQAGQAVKNNGLIKLDTSSGLQSADADIEIRYNGGSPQVGIEVEIPEDDVPYRVRELAQNPDSLGQTSIDEEALREVNYGEIIAQNYNEIVAGHLQPLVEEGVVERETLQEYGLDLETAKVTDLTEISLSDPSREEISEVLSALYQSVEEVEGYQTRLSWNIIGASPFRDNEYTRA